MDTVAYNIVCPCTYITVSLYTSNLRQYESEGEEHDEGDGVVHERRKRRLHKSKKKTSIYDVYEPSELERGHFTERDSEIRVTDVPERFQVSYRITTRIGPTGKCY